VTHCAARQPVSGLLTIMVGVPFRFAAPLAFAATWIVIDRTRSGLGWTAISPAVFVAAEYAFGLWY